MGAQRFRGADPVLSDGSTLLLLLCVVVAACRSTMLVVEAEVLCSVAQRKRVGQFLVGRVTARGACDEGTGPRVLFWKGDSGACCGLEWVARVSLCVLVLFALSWSCVPRGSFVFLEGSARCRLQASEGGTLLTGRVCLMLAVFGHGDPKSWAVKSGFLVFLWHLRRMQLFVSTL